MTAAAVLLLAALSIVGTAYGTTLNMDNPVHAGGGAYIYVDVGQVWVEPSNPHQTNVQLVIAAEPGRDGDYVDRMDFKVTDGKRTLVERNDTYGSGSITFKADTARLTTTTFFFEFNWRGGSGSEIFRLAEGPAFLPTSLWSEEDVTIAGLMLNQLHAETSATIAALEARVASLEATVKTLLDRLGA